MAAVLASAAAVQLAVAQTVDVSNCVELTKPEERLACFEAQLEAARDTPPAAALDTAPAAALDTSQAAGPAAATNATPDDFGFSEEIDNDERESPPDLIAKVVELRETVPNAYLITLDNGQVWRQTQPRYDYSLRPGFEVRIYESRWSSFRLTSPQQRGYLQVERVR